MKVRPEILADRERVRFLDSLYTAAGSLRGRADIKAFLKDLLTLSERIMLGRRIAIAQLLLAGRSYDEIRGELGVGPDTIRRIHRWLVDDHPGYEKAIEGMREAVARRGSSPTALLARLKRKYPLHFLLFPSRGRK